MFINWKDSCLEKDVLRKIEGMNMNKGYIVM